MELLDRALGLALRGQNRGAAAQLVHDTIPPRFVDRGGQLGGRDDSGGEDHRDDQHATSPLSNLREPLVLRGRPRDRVPGAVAYSTGLGTEKPLDAGASRAYFPDRRAMVECRVWTSPDPFVFLGR